MFQILPKNARLKLHPLAKMKGHSNRKPAVFTMVPRVFPEIFLRERERASRKAAKTSHEAASRLVFADLRLIFSHAETNEKPLDQGGLFGLVLKSRTYEFHIII